MSGPLTVERVIVGVDFDAPSAAAVHVAGTIADAFGASLVAVHAATIDVPAYFTRGQVPALEMEEQERRARLAEEVRRFVAGQTAGLSDVRIEEGPPAAALVQRAGPADLLVVGTHRLKGPQRWWLGSVAEAVVRQARTPVLVVPSGGDDRTTLRPGGSILVPTSAADPRVEVWVGGLAQALVAQVARANSVDTCPAALLRQSELVVVPLVSTAVDDASFERVIHVLKECTRPVLFVPPAGKQAPLTGDPS